MSVCENITILLFDLLQITYFYHKITKTSEALLSRMNESLSRMNACLCDFVMVLVGRKSGKNRLNWLRTHGRGAKASCNISRMRKAYFCHSILYDGAVCSHFPKRCTH